MLLIIHFHKIQMFFLFQMLIKQCSLLIQNLPEKKAINNINSSTV